jgi:hypothetical protein
MTADGRTGSYLGTHRSCGLLRSISVSVTILLLLSGGCGRPRQGQVNRAGESPDAEPPGPLAEEHMSSLPLWERIQRLGLMSPDYSVVRAYIAHEWESFPSPPVEFFLTGTRPAVDQRLGTWTFQVGNDDGLPDLGQGVVVSVFPVMDALYKDARGIRLVAAQGTWLDTLILSAQNTHDARLVDRDLSSLRTESGIGLGDSQARVLDVLGSPSCRYRFGEYEILWYLQKPRQYTVAHLGNREFSDGHVAAYALANDRVVEIWLHEWTTEPAGG